MYIFNQRPANEQRLMEYFNKLIIDLKAANNKYKEQNDYLRARNRKLETEIFYSSGNHDSVKILKENAKLKRSLRKLYEKYIKPYRGRFEDRGRVVNITNTGDHTIYLKPLTPDEMFSAKEGSKENNKVWRKLALKSFNSGK